MIASKQGIAGVQHHVTMQANWCLQAYRCVQTNCYSATSPWYGHAARLTGGSVAFWLCLQPHSCLDAYCHLVCAVSCPPGLLGHSLLWCQPSSLVEKEQWAACVTSSLCLCCLWHSSWMASLHTHGALFSSYPGCGLERCSWALLWWV